MSDFTKTGGYRPSGCTEPNRSHDDVQRTAPTNHNNLNLRIARAHALAVLAHPARGLRR